MSLIPANVDQRRFGRIAAPDKRDKNYQASRFVLSLESLPRVRHWATGKVLDQGMTPHCVEYSGRQWLMSNPVRNQWPGDYGSLYKLCQQNDEWDGEDYDGTSVRALFKVLQSNGYVDGYAWAWDNFTVTAWILQHGPMVLGTDWYEGMMETDRDGFIHAPGAPVGGHAYLLHGTNRNKLCPDGTRGAHRICQSWGTAWGEHGYCWLSYKDTELLLANQGEACTAIEVKR